MSNDKSQQLQREAVEKMVYQSFVSSLDEAKSNANLIFELQYNNDTILSLFKDANLALAEPNTMPLIKQKIAAALAQTLSVSYHNFSSQKIYLPDGELLIQFNNGRKRYSKKQPENPILDEVLKNLKPSSGLTLDNGRYVNHYFFPMFDKQNQLIAVVALAIPLTDIQLAFTEKNKSKVQYLFAKRPLLALHQKNLLYEESEFSSSFVTDKEQNKQQVPQERFNGLYLNKISTGLNAENQTQLLQLNKFSMNLTIDDEYGVAVFMPVMDVYGYKIGGILSFTPITKLHVSQYEHSLITLILLLMLGFTLIFAFKKATEVYYLQSNHQHLLDAFPFPIFLKNCHHQYCAANKAFYNLFNLHDSPSLNQKQLTEYEPDELKLSIKEINDAGGLIEIESNKLKEDSATSYQISFCSMTQDENSKQMLVGYINDINERVLLSESLKKLVCDHAKFMDMLPLGLRVFDLNGKTTYVNKVFKGLSGFNTNDILSTDCETIFNCNQCDSKICPAHKSKMLKHNHRVEVIKYTTNGEPRTYELTYYPYFSTHQDMQGIVEITRDISINKSLLDKNHELMLSDEMTSLSNYRGLMNLGENYFRLAVRADKPFYVLFIDIVDLGDIYTEYGEKEATQLLVIFADILKETFRETDILARTGSDEFVVLMNDSEYEIIDNTRFARLENNIDAFNAQSNKAYSLVIETGIVEYKKDIHRNLNALIKDAEQLVYENRLKRRLK
jgi:diguanylate cyclase (GGDEF)-like protein